MINVEIPGLGEVRIENLVMDYNGTLAIDGHLIGGVGKIITQLADKLTLCVITANTHGGVETELMGLPIELVKLNSRDERREKASLIQELGPHVTVSIGNGKNDEFMLKESVVGICVMGAEGCSAGALLSSDVVTGNVKDALEMLVFPDRLKATLRF